MKKTIRLGIVAGLTMVLAVYLAGCSFSAPSLT